MPSYVDPPTFVAAATLTAADLNVAMDDIRVLRTDDLAQAFQGVSLIKSTFTLANATYAAISWGSSPIDIGSWWSSGTDIVVPSSAIPPGYSTIVVEISALVQWVSNSANARRVQFEVNGSVQEGQLSVTAINGDTTELFNMVWAVVAAGDVITVVVYQNSGGGLGTSAFGHVKRLGPV